jgi:arylsulfatase A-like enzyme
MKVLVVGCWLLVATLNTLAAGAQKPPNVLFLLVDDWGAGDVDMCPPDIPYDLCPFRSTTDGRKSTLHTPRIKRMASEGQILTNFYAPRAICTPSRAGYLSGRDPARYGLVDELFRILPSSSARGGFPQSEKSVAEYMKELGYATGYSGKWHMGQTNGIDPAYYTPINHGFDDVRFFVEGSNGEQCEAGALNPPDDNNIYHMCTFDHIQNCDSKAGTCEVVEQPIRWENVTARHLEVTKDFINQHKDDESPWFYQHSFLHVHVPWVPGRYFVTDPQLKVRHPRQAILCAYVNLSHSSLWCHRSLSSSGPIW